MKKREISPEFIVTVKSGSADTAKEYLRGRGLYCPCSERCVHLAYAYLRGQPYRVAEPTAAPLDVSLGKHSVPGFKKALAGAVTVASKESPAPLVPTPEQIAAWMAEPEPEDRKAKRVAKEQASAAARAARRQARLLEMGMETR